MRHLKRKIAIATTAALALAVVALPAAAQAATKPVLTVESAAAVTAFSAELAGTVDPGEASTSCRFGVVPDALFQGSKFAKARYTACDQGTIEGSGAQPVSAQVTMRPNTLYHFDLEAGNEAGKSSLEGESFTTPTVPPQSETGPNTPFPGGKVHLLGYVDPEEMSVTSCKFVYGLEAGNYDHEAPCANHPGNEIQALNLGAIGGKLKLEFEGEVTADLPYNATAAEVQSALRALPAIGPNGVSVETALTLPDFRRYLVTFEGPLADKSFGLIERKEGSESLQVGPTQTLTYALVVERLDEGGLGGPHEVVADLNGLEAGATYHYRLVAGNGAGQSESADAIFKAAEEESPSCTNEGALGTSFLAECRAYEMVSPPDKNGGDVLILSKAVRAAADGSAASFASPSPFGDASGAGADSEYESIRTEDGWLTHGIFPRQPAGTYAAAVEGLFPHYAGEFSPDADRGIFFAIRPLDESDPNVEEVVNLYLRTDLRSPGAGTYRLLTGCPLCAEKNQPLKGFSGPTAPKVVGASEDFKHVVFESLLNLVKGAASPSTKLYEGEDGTVRLVGILPGGGVPSESRGVGGHGVLKDEHGVSKDGSKIVFMSGNNLYLRLNHETTIQLNESELPSPEGNGTADFADATPNLERILFSDKARLTEGAPNGGGLYVYDTTKPSPDPENLTFVGNAAEGQTGFVPSIDPSGNTVYFDQSVWHDGQVRDIGRIYLGSGPEQRQAADGSVLFLQKDRAPHPLQRQFDGYCPNNAGHPLCRAFYTYNPTTEALQCVTCPVPGEAVQQVDPEIEHNNVGAGANFDRMNHPISADGKHVFFATSAALLPEDTNGVTDVYTFDTETAQVSLISRGVDPYPSYFMEATPSGSDAFFTTRQRLSGWDFDSNQDLYDARVGGGLPEPVPVPAGCEGEACLPPPGSPPRVGASGSESFSGPGNPKPPEHKKRHKKHKKHGGKRRHHSKQGGRK